MRRLLLSAAALLVILGVALGGCTGEWWECECQAVASDDDDSAADPTPYLVTLCSDQGWPDRAADAAVRSCLDNVEVVGAQVGCSCSCDDQQRMCAVQ